MVKLSVSNSIRKISLVLPSYKELGNLKVLTPRLISVLDSLPCKHELIFIIDGDDGSKQYIEDAQKSLSGGTVKISYSSTKRGIGNSFREGFATVSPDTTHVVTMDCDLNHRPEELERLIRKYRETNADIIIGSRYLEAHTVKSLPVWKRLLSFLMNRAVSIAIGIDIRDKTSGYRLYSKVVTDLLATAIRGNDFSVYPEILVVAARNGFSIAETPITFDRRISGQSKLPKFRTGVGYFSLLARYSLKRVLRWLKSL